VRLGSGEHYGWDETRTVRLVAVVDGERAPGEFALLQVPAGAKGGPLAVAVRPRTGTGIWVDQTHRRRVGVGAWELTPDQAESMARHAGGADAGPWVPPTPGPGMWLYVERSEGELAAPRDRVRSAAVESPAGPRFAGLSFRGADPARAGTRADTTVTSADVVVTSRDPRVATNNGAVRGVYAVLGDRGHRIDRTGAAPEEREIAYARGTRFRLGPTEVIAGFVVTFAEQLNPRRLPELAARLTTDWARSVTRTLLTESDWHTPVAIGDPERFVGPLGS